MAKLKITTGRNGSAIVSSMTLDRRAAFYWAKGYNDGQNGAPWDDLLGHPKWAQVNYECGRLYAAEGKAAGITMKPWRVDPHAKTTRVPYPVTVGCIAHHVVATTGARVVPVASVAAVA